MTHTRSLLTAVLTAIASTVTFAQNAPYMVPANADGVILKSGDDYPDKIRMEGSDGIYTLENQELSSGIVFLGVSDVSTGNYSEYSMPSWAVSPAVIGYSNPLIISAGKTIPVSPGTYDVVFYDRNVSGNANHMFLLRPSDSTGERLYPPALFLVTGSSAVKVTQSADTAGFYSVFTDMPAEMQISYEPRTSYDKFVYGPATAGGNLLRSGEALTLGYGVNTAVRLRPDAAATGKKLLDAGQRVRVDIDLRDAGAPTVTVANEETQAIGEIETDGQVEILVSGGRITVSGADDRIKELYTPSGLCLYRGADGDLGCRPSGLYIVRVGDTVAKIAVTR